MSLAIPETFRLRFGLRSLMSLAIPEMVRLRFGLRSLPPWCYRLALPMSDVYITLGPRQKGRWKAWLLSFVCLQRGRTKILVNEKKL